jgi:hypothetical protein
METGVNGPYVPNRLLWGAFALIAIVVTFINATSILMERHSLGVPIESWEPFFWEASSAICMVAMAPLVGRAVHRWPLQWPRLIGPILIHLLLTVPFSFAHVIGLLAIRETVYRVLGKTYDFFLEGVPLTLLYEWRKDLITYAIFAGGYALAERLSRPPAASPPDTKIERIEVREGGRTLFLEPKDILCVDAAGNYVEIVTATARHLVRDTLAAWEKKLASHGIVRIHRSRLVNTAHIKSVSPTASGDFEIVLINGQAVQGSRRFRDAIRPSVS